MDKELIRIEKLIKRFPTSGTIVPSSTKWVTAVDGINLVIKKGETLGLVGESGCGKSTLGRLILRLIEPTSGKIYYKGNSISDISQQELRALRKQIQIIFQDPYASLNPRMTVESFVGEPFAIFNLAKRVERRERVEYLLNQV